MRRRDAAALDAPAQRADLRPRPQVDRVVEREPVQDAPCRAADRVVIRHGPEVVVSAGTTVRSTELEVTPAWGVVKFESAGGNPMPTKQWAVPPTSLIGRPTSKVCDA